MPPSDLAAWLASPAGAGAALAGAWAAGCMAGSFINVVAHRVPRGETVVYGRSHCPACGAMIRARDNVPVLGWLLLRGRCRDCGAAISARYPLVEAACGGLAAVLAAAEMAAVPAGGVAAASIAAWAWRTTLALTIVAWSMLAARGHAISATAAGAATAAATVAAATIDSLGPLPVGCGTPTWTQTVAWPGCLAASLAGMLTGWAAAAGGGRTTQAACMLAGAAGGWQAALVAAAAAGAMRLLGGHDAAPCIATVAAIISAHPLARVWASVCRFASDT